MTKWTVRFVVLCACLLASASVYAHHSLAGVYALGKEAKVTGAFKARGGKLLLYHGWNDGLISPGNTVNYFTDVNKTMGKGQDDFVRLFMAPGVGHCQGGAGPDQVNWMGALERWRESGKAPDRIEAARVAGNRIEMTRPLCPYPQIAKYTGTGSTNDAQNFLCSAR